jgi:hypothetical protein
MFIESVQYSLESVRIVIKNIYPEKKVLPVSTSANNVKCLDFDLDKTVFRQATKTLPKIEPIHPYKKTMLEAMDMV